MASPFALALLAGVGLSVGCVLVWHDNDKGGNSNNSALNKHGSGHGSLRQQQRSQCKHAVTIAVLLVADIVLFVAAAFTSPSDLLPIPFIAHHVWNIGKVLRGTRHFSPRLGSSLLLLAAACVLLQLHSLEIGVSNTVPTSAVRPTDTRLKHFASVPDNASTLAAAHLAAAASARLPPPARAQPPALDPSFGSHETPVPPPPMLWRFASVVMLLGACAEVSRILLGQINVFTARSGAAVIGGFACIAVWYVSHSYFGATIVRYSGDALGLLEAASRAVVTPLHSGGLRASSITSGTRARAQDALLPHPQPALLRAPYIHNSNVSHSAVGHSLNTGAVTPGTFGMSWQYGSSALGLAIVVFLSVVHSLALRYIAPLFKPLEASFVYYLVLGLITLISHFTFGHLNLMARSTTCNITMQLLSVVVLDAGLLLSAVEGPTSWRSGDPEKPNDVYKAWAHTFPTLVPSHLLSYLLRLWSANKDASRARAPPACRHGPDQAPCWHENTLTRRFWKELCCPRGLGTIVARGRRQPTQQAPVSAHTSA